MKLILFCFMMVGFLPLSQSYAASMTVDADKFELFQTEQRADFFGHVVVHRENMVLKADQMHVWYKDVEGANELQRVKAKGNVFIETAQHKGTSNKASFSADTDMLILTGDARMESDQGILEGEQIEYNTVTEDTKVLQGKKDSQVHFSFEETK
ncbi:MAG: LptA/OstA family protein [Ghiorsea sp.]